MTDAYERAKRDDEAWEREHDSREKLEAEVYNHIAISITPNEENDGVLAPYATVLEWLDRQAAITQADTMAHYREELKRRTKRESMLQSKVDELQAALNEAAGKWARADAHARELQAELGSEPFCSQVKRWLGGDAPQECRECGDGCYRELCEAFGVKPKRTVEDVLEEFIAAYDEWDDNCHEDREGQRQTVFEKYADELRGMGVCDE